MEKKTAATEVKELIKKYSAEFNYEFKETAVILAAGHGKRIKSSTSKMLHKIAGIPTVERIHNSCAKGLDKSNIIVVVGIKADEVMNTVGKKENTGYAYQEVQHGTGHAAQIALENIDTENYDGIVYVLPGDMGLYDAETMEKFRTGFIQSGNDMMVLTGLFEGNADENAYGRIIRVKEKDATGNSSGDDFGNVIEIMENKDILALEKDYVTDYKGKKYSFSKEELINNNEFNSGVFAFKFKPLVKLIRQIQSNNAQSEIYLTDLISLFNKEGLAVGAVNPEKQYVLMGFNNKSVLREMNKFARDLVYEKLKDIVEIEDPQDFFIAEEVADELVKMDSDGLILDIKVGKGAIIDRGVKISPKTKIGRNVKITGDVKLAEGIHINRNCIVEGNISIGKNSRIMSNVILMGDSENPLVIGDNVKIEGISKIKNCKIENDVIIEHCSFENKTIKKNEKDGRVQKVSYFLPSPTGIEAIK